MMTKGRIAKSISSTKFIENLLLLRRSRHRRRTMAVCCFPAAAVASTNSISTSATTSTALGSHNDNNNNTYRQPTSSGVTYNLSHHRHQQQQLLLPPRRRFVSTKRRARKQQEQQRQKKRDKKTNRRHQQNQHQHHQSSSSQQGERKNIPLQRPTHSHPSLDPHRTSLTVQETAVHRPPSFFFSTASPNAFVAKCAIVASDEREDGITNTTTNNNNNVIDPSTLFSDVTDELRQSSSGSSNNFQIPRLFKRPGQFEHLGCISSFSRNRRNKDEKNNNLHFLFHDQSNNNTNNNAKTKAPQVAFLGRSNVGKSSLINALVKRQNLARTSKRPGRTQEVHFFGWIGSSNTGSGSAAASLRQKAGSSRSSKKRTKQNSPTDKVATSSSAGWLVDLPGYGFAVGSAAAVSDWQAVSQDYLQLSTEQGLLRRLYLLQDGRHGTQAFDATVQAWMDDAGIPYTVVLTKADAATKPNLLKWVNQCCMRYTSDARTVATMMSPIVHVCSAATGEGLAELWSSIEADFLYAGEEDDGDGDDTEQHWID